METTNNPNLTDIAPAPVITNNWEKTTGQLDNKSVFNFNSGFAPIARPIQSSNYRKGTRGWRLNTGGEIEINGKVPASASAVGTAGTIVHDTSYIYVCTAKDTWKRVAIATW